jgi:hypothetical protein
LVNYLLYRAAMTLTYAVMTGHRAGHLAPHVPNEMIGSVAGHDGACWLPIVAIQMRMKAMLEPEAVAGSLDEAMPTRLFGWWFAPGRPGFGGLIVVFFLMAAKPSW